MRHLTILALFLSSLASAGPPALPKKLILAGPYSDKVSSSMLPKALEAFQKTTPLAICADSLKKGHFQSKKLGCTKPGNPGSKPGECGPEKNQIVTYEVDSDCGAGAFMLGFDDMKDLKEGPIKQVPFTAVEAKDPQKGSSFELNGKKYRVTAWTGTTPEDSRGSIQLFEGDKKIAQAYKAPEGDFDCVLKWVGDLNGDGTPDMIFRCNQRIYEHIAILALSFPKKDFKYRTFTSTLPELTN